MPKRRPGARSTTSAPKRGRKRSPEAHAAILAAAMRVLEDRGWAGASVEAIASEAGVGKQTIYRWWPLRGALYLEVLRTLANESVDLPATGSLESDLREFLTQTFAAIGEPVQIVLVSLMAEAQSNPAFHRQFHDELIQPRREALAPVFEAARERGEIRAEAPIESALDLVFGGMWYRLLLRRGQLSPAFAAELARAASQLVASPERA